MRLLMRINANAKINLTLDVVRKREDGYHELDMIMVPLTLCDTLEITLSDRDEIICGKENFPLTKQNTIYQAIAIMRETFHLQEHFKVIVEKKIPMQAGLAGGSADGAAMLKAIVALCHLHVEEEQLLTIAKKIGADVPFCVVNEVARVQGIGEKVRRFALSTPFHLLLVKPKEGVSTGKAFSMIDFEHCDHPNVDLCEKALKENDYETFCQCIGNTLEQPALLITPIIANIKKELKALGMDAVLMSGSGSTVFAISQDEILIHKAKEHMAKRYDFVMACEIVR